MSLSCGRLPEEAGGTQEEHADDDEIDREDLELRVDHERDCADEPDEQRADQGTRHRAQPADDDDRERFDHDLDAHLERGGSRRHDQRAPERTEQRADREHDGVDLPHVDAERLGHGAVLGRGPQQPPEVRSPQQRPDADRRSNGRRDHQEIVARHAELPDRHLPVDQVDVVERFRIGAPDEAKHVLEHQHQREREEQLEALVAVVDGPQQAFDKRPDSGHQNTGSNQHRQQEHRRHPRLLSIRHRGDAEIGPERVERTAGEIDDLLDAEDELQARGNQEQDGGMEDAADRDIGECRHAFSADQTLNCAVFSHSQKLAPAGFCRSAEYIVSIRAGSSVTKSYLLSCVEKPCTKVWSAM